MLQSTARLALLVTALATLTACDAELAAPDPAAPASAAALAAGVAANTVHREENTVPFSFVVFASCANGGEGEVLQAHGELHYRGHWVTSDQGQRNHYVVVSRFLGTAVGWDSGEVYDIARRDLTQGNIDYGSDGIPDSGEELQRIRLQLTSRDTGATIDVVLVGRFVQTPAGEYVLDGWDGTARCD